MAESISTPAHLKNQEYIPSKICMQCGFIKPATSLYFQKEKHGKYGIKGCCKKCEAIKNKQFYKDNFYILSERQREYRSKNKEKILKRERELYLINREKRKKQARELYRKYIEKEKERRKKYYYENKEVVAIKYKQYTARPEVRKRLNEQQRERSKNPTQRLCNRISGNLRQSIKNKNGSKSFDILGFTKEQLVKHIEKQFKDGMSWDLFLKGEIHIDHKLPISKFNFKTPDDPDFKICWSLKNLQPMWAKENLSKNNKLEKPLQMSLSFSE